MSLRLSNRKILLTGATRGIGRQMLDILCENGAHVLAVARSETALVQLERAYPGQVSTLAADLSEPDMPRAIAHWVADQHPDCSVLINNAAIMIHTDLTDGAARHEEAIEREVEVNLIAPMQLAVLMMPVLRRQRTAAIVNVTSGLAISPIANAAVYCATKAGLRQFSKALRAQCAGSGITVHEAVMTLVDTSLSLGDPAGKLPPRAAAQAVLRGVEAGQSEIWIERTRLLRLVWRLSPALADRIMLARTPALPHSP